MSDLHVATSSQKAREMVEVVLAEFDRWAESAPGQAAGEIGGDYRHGSKVADRALYNVRTDLDDHLVVAVGATLASWVEED